MMPWKQVSEIALICGGIPVWGCAPGSSAERAGLRYGDIVMSVNGQRVKSLEEYLEARKLRGDGMDVCVLRAGIEIWLFVSYAPPSQRALPKVEQLWAEPTPFSSGPRLAHKAVS